MIEPTRRFDKIEIDAWRQFDYVEVDFHARLTVLTGANGSGKTTILNTLSRHFGWSLPLASTPNSRSERIAQYVASRRKREETTAASSGGLRHIGAIRYSDGTFSQLMAPVEPGVRYEVTFSQTPDVPGIYVTSHRPVYTQQQVDTVPARVDSVEQILNKYLELNRNRYSPGASQSPTIRIKEALISWAAFGLGNDVVAPNVVATEAYQGFVEVLRRFLPPSIGFRRLRIDVPEVILETRSAEFSFDSSSGGVAALIDLAWQAYLYSMMRPTFALLIDEPENHLHPELQRSLLGRLLDTFPGVQVVVATHNPLVVGSVEESNVYALRRARGSQGVTSQRLSLRTKAASANEILRSVLGIESTIPLWAESEISRVLDELGSGPLTPPDVDRLATNLHRLGLADHVPQALQMWAERRH